jgi:chromosome segregation ATPase
MHPRELKDSRKISNSSTSIKKKRQSQNFKYLEERLETSLDFSNRDLSENFTFEDLEQSAKSLSPSNLPPPISNSWGNLLNEVDSAFAAAQRIPAPIRVSEMEKKASTITVSPRPTSKIPTPLKPDREQNVLVNVFDGNDAFLNAAIDSTMYFSQVNRTLTTAKSSAQLLEEEKDLISKVVDIGKKLLTEKRMRDASLAILNIQEDHLMKKKASDELIDGSRRVDMILADLLYYYQLIHNNSVNMILKQDEEKLEEQAKAKQFFQKLENDIDKSLKIRKDLTTMFQTEGDETTAKLDAEIERFKMQQMEEEIEKLKKESESYAIQLKTLKEENMALNLNFEVKQADLNAKHSKDIDEIKHKSEQVIQERDSYMDFLSKIVPRDYLFNQSKVETEIKQVQDTLESMKQVMKTLQADYKLNGHANVEPVVKSILEKNRTLQFDMDALRAQTEELISRKLEVEKHLQISVMRENTLIKELDEEKRKLHETMRTASEYEKVQKDFEQKVALNNSKRDASRQSTYNNISLSEALSNEIDLLNSERDYLVDRANKLKLDLDAKNSQIEKLVEEKGEINRNYEFAFLEKDELATQLKSIKSENAILVEAKTKLEADFVRLQSKEAKLVELESKYAELQKKYDEVSRNAENVSSDLEYLRDIIAEKDEQLETYATKAVDAGTVADQHKSEVLNKTFEIENLYVELENIKQKLAALQQELDASKNHIHELELGKEESSRTKMSLENKIEDSQYELNLLKVEMKQTKELLQEKEHANSKQESLIKEYEEKIEFLRQEQYQKDLIEFRLKALEEEKIELANISSQKLDKETAELKSEIKGLRDSLEAAKNENELHVLDISTFKGEIKTLKESLEVSRKESDLLMTEMNTLKRELKTVTDDRDFFQLENSVLKGQVEELNNKTLKTKDSAAEEVNQLRTTINSLENEKSEHLAKIASLEAENRTFVLEERPRMETIKKDFADIFVERQKMKDEIQALHDRLEQEGNEKTELKNETENLLKTKEEVSKQKEEIFSEISILKEQLAEMKEQLYKKEEEITAKQFDINFLQEKVASESEEIASLKSKLGEANERYERLSKKDVSSVFNNIKAENPEQTDHENLVRTLKRMQQVLGSSDNEADKLHLEVISKDDTIQGLEREIKEFTKKIECLEKERDEVKTRILELEQQAQALGEEKKDGVSKLESKIAELTEKLDTTTDLLNVKEKFIKDLEKIIEESHKENKKTNNIEQLQNKYIRLKDKEHQLSVTLDKQIAREEAIQIELDKSRHEIDRYAQQLASYDIKYREYEKEIELLKHINEGLQEKLDDFAQKFLSGWQPKGKDENNGTVMMKGTIAEDLRDILREFQGVYHQNLRRQIKEKANLKKKLKNISREKELDDFQRMSVSTQTFFK